jgi:hypothetical protein
MISAKAKYLCMPTSKPLISICSYKVKPGKEAEMERLLAQHWPALHRVGLASDQKAIVYRGLPSDKPGGEHGAERTYLEILVWRDQSGPDLAHQMPEVMAVWEPMGAICDDMDFPSYEPLELPYHKA